VGSAFRFAHGGMVVPLPATCERSGAETT
jgi:uncharacterized protein (DUF111 family)